MRPTRHKADTDAKFDPTIRENRSKLRHLRNRVGREIGERIYREFIDSARDRDWQDALRSRHSGVPGLRQLGQ